ncbi:aryl hydrocarbon receptor nuclear translocator-like protein 1 isoform X1, partial [Lates japonicus]
MAHQGGLFQFPIQLRAQEWMEGDDFNTEAVMNICDDLMADQRMDISSTMTDFMSPG